MHIFYKDISDLCLSNVGDPIWNGHKRTNPYISPHITHKITLFLLVLFMANLPRIDMKESEV